MMRGAFSPIGCRRAVGLWTACLWLWLTLLPGQLFAAPPSEEYELKAALIYKLSKFVGWPDPVEISGPRPFGICVLGEDAFGSALDVLETRKTGGRAIQVKRVAQSESIDSSCQVVFISESKRPFLQPILRSLEAQPILTLSDSEGFAEQGGIIELTRSEKRVGFKINLQSAKHSGLKISAPLLELATVIGSSDGQAEK